MYLDKNGLNVIIKVSRNAKEKAVKEQVICGTQTESSQLVERRMRKTEEDQS